MKNVSAKVKFYGNVRDTFVRIILFLFSAWGGKTFSRMEAENFHERQNLLINSNFKKYPSLNSMSLMNIFHLINNFLAVFLFMLHIQWFTHAARLQKHSYVQCQLKNLIDDVRKRNESELNIIDYQEPLKITVPRGLLRSLENLMDY